MHQLRFVVFVSTLALMVGACGGDPSATPPPSGGSVYVGAVAGTDGDGISDDDELYLAERFAPYLHLHPDEKFYPVSAEYAISNSELFRVGAGLVDANPTAVSISKFTDPLSGYYLDNKQGSIDDNGIE